MLERYYKSKQDFEEFLDKTYDPASFLKFIESFVSLPYEVKTRANNFRYEDITNNIINTIIVICINLVFIFRPPPLQYIFPATPPP